MPTMTRFYIANCQFYAGLIEASKLPRRERRPLRLEPPVTPGHLLVGFALTSGLFYGLVPAQALLDAVVVPDAALVFSAALAEHASRYSWPAAASMDAEAFERTMESVAKVLEPHVASGRPMACRIWREEVQEGGVRKKGRMFILFEVAAANSADAIQSGEMTLTEARAAQGLPPLNAETLAAMEEAREATGLQDRAVRIDADDEKPHSALLEGWLL